MALMTPSTVDNALARSTMSSQSDTLVYAQMELMNGARCFDNGL